MRLTKSIIAKVVIISVLTLVWAIGLCICESLFEQGRYLLGASLVIVPIGIISWMFSSGRCEDVITYLDTLKG